MQYEMNVKWSNKYKSELLNMDLHFCVTNKE